MFFVATATFRIPYTSGQAMTDERSLFRRNQESHASVALPPDHGDLSLGTPHFGICSESETRRAARAFRSRVKGMSLKEFVIANVSSDRSAVNLDQAIVFNEHHCRAFYRATFKITIRFEYIFP
jgi:hypothetical protein